MLELDIGLRAALLADSDPGGVAALATGGIHQQDAPDKTVEPYVIFQEASDFGIYALGNSLKADHVFYLIRGVAGETVNGNTNESGVVIVAKIADRARILFTNPTLTVSGKTVLSCRFDRSYPPLKERDEINQRWIYVRGVLVEIWLS